MRRKFEDDEIEFIKEVAPGRSSSEISDMFNARFRDRDYVIPRQIKDAMKYRGIRNGIENKFQKGVATRHVPVGHCKISPFGTKKNGERYYYEMVKVAEPNVWKRKSLLEWEKYNGPLGNGEILIFLDGNTLNSNIENLMAVRRGVHFRLNRFRVMKPSREYMLAAIKVAEIEDAVEQAKQKRRRIK